MYDVDFQKPTAVLLGGEGAGLPEDLAAAADTRVSIPMHGAVESLNAAVAAAVLLYEAQQRPQRSRMSLFDDEPAPVDPKTIPLAERMRPRSLDEIVGQDDLVSRRAGRCAR